MLEDYVFLRMSYLIFLCYDDLYDHFTIVVNIFVSDVVERIDYI